MRHPHGWHARSSVPGRLCTRAGIVVPRGCPSRGRAHGGSRPCGVVPGCGVAAPHADLCRAPPAPETTGDATPAGAPAATASSSQATGICRGQSTPELKKALLTTSQKAESCWHLLQRTAPKAVGACRRSRGPRARPRPSSSHPRATGTPPGAGAPSTPRRWRFARRASTHGTLDVPLGRASRQSQAGARLSPPRWAPRIPRWLRGSMLERPSTPRALPSSGLAALGGSSGSLHPNPGRAQLAALVRE